MKKVPRKSVEVSVYKSGSIFQSFNSFIEELTDAMESIPDEYKEHATIDIDCVEGRYNDDYEVQINVNYYRDETNAELETRILKEKEYARQVRDRELATLESLEKKYRRNSTV